MIFVTVGSQDYPFDRLFKVIDANVKIGKIKQDVIAQIGTSNYLPKMFPYKRYINYDEVIENIKDSEIVIAHAGIGTTILCLNLAKIPIIFPRFAKFGEQVDDHQVEFAERIERENRVLIAYDEDDLIDKINNYKKYLAKLNIIEKNINKKSLIDYLRLISS